MVKKNTIRNIWQGGNMKTRSNLLKRIGAFVLAISLTAGMLATTVQPSDASTNYEVKKVIYTKNYKQSNGVTYFAVKGEFPEIKDDSDAAKKINQALIKEKERLIKQWKDNADDCKDENRSGHTYGDKLSYKVTSNNGKYFSVMLSGYLDLGGAHGMPYRSCLTFDSKTGEKLTAADIYDTSKSKLNQKVQALYLAKYDKDGKLGFYGEGKDERKNLQKALKDMNFNNDFYIQNGRAVFYADPYALGPYAAGYIEVSAAAR